MLTIETMHSTFCPHCGVRALIVNNDYALLASHLWINHKQRWKG